jgi:hypothetical protein
MVATVTGNWALAMPADAAKVPPDAKAKRLFLRMGFLLYRSPKCFRPIALPRADEATVVANYFFYYSGG